MYDLQLLGVHEDGEHVVFLGTDGQRYRVLIDDALRAAVRRDRAHLGQIQVASQTLRPRDIQARVRAGQRAEQIAAESGLALDYIERFEGPVLAERENVVTRARQTRIRRRDEVGPMLGQLTDERLEARGVDLQYGTVWDAWRQDDGTWAVQLLFSAGGKDRTARWRFDMPAAHLTPTDDESRWLTSEQQDQPGRRHRDNDPDGTLDRILRRRMETVEISAPWRERRDAAETPQPSPPIALPDPAPQDAAGEAAPAPFSPQAGQQDSTATSTGHHDAPTESVVEAEPVEPAAVTRTGPAEPATPEPVVQEVVQEDVAAPVSPPQPDPTRDHPSNDEPQPAAEEAAPPPPQDRSTAGRAQEPPAEETEPAPLPPAAHPADSHPEDLEDGTIVASAGDGDSYIEVTIDATDPAPPKDAPGQSNPDTVDEDEAKEQVANATSQSASGRDSRPKPGPRSRKQKKRNNRASVPSWDDILFGAKKD